MTSPSDPMQLIKERTINAMLNAHERNGGQPQAYNGLDKHNRAYWDDIYDAALQALTAASGTERVGVDLAVAGDQLHAALYDLCSAYSKVQEWFAFKTASPYITNANDALKSWVTAKSSLLAQPVPAPAEKDGGDYVDIVFDRLPGHEGSKFIEVENSQGKSIRFGECGKKGG